MYVLCVNLLRIQPPPQKKVEVIKNALKNHVRAETELRDATPMPNLLRWLVFADDNGDDDDGDDTRTDQRHLGHTMAVVSPWADRRSSR